MKPADDHPDRLMQRPFSSISVKVVAWVLLFSSVFAIGITAAVIFLHHLEERAEAKVQLQLVAQNTSKSLAASLWDLDMPGARLQLDALAGLPMIGHVRLSTAIGQKFHVHKDPAAVSRFAPDELTSFTTSLRAPIAPEREVGQLELFVDNDALWAQLRNDALRILIAESIKIFTLALLLSWLITQMVTRHVSHIARQAALLQPSDLDRGIVLERKPGRSEDELDQLRDAFNHLNAGLAAYIKRQQTMEAELRAHRDGLTQMVEERTNSLLVTQHALQEANQELYALSRHDALTNLANRRHFDDAKLSEFRRARRTDLPLSVLMCDVDDFKAFNDSYGHAEGDRCLKIIGDCLRSLFVRAGELPARLGGEEFAILLPNTTQEQAMGLAQRLREAVKTLAMPHHHSRAAEVVTISIGIASLKPTHREFDELLQDADDALYKAKVNGRNRVELAD